MFLYQHQYASDIILCAKMKDCNLVRVPVDTESKLSYSVRKLINDPTTYRSLFSALQYLILTCGDISYIVQQVYMHLHAPRTAHLNALKRVVM